MVIFKRMTMPKEKFPKDIVVKINKKGWMIESVMKEFFPQKKSIASFGQDEGPHNRFCERSRQENQVNSSCDSWRHNKVFTATWHKCEPCI